MTDDPHYDRVRRATEFLLTQVRQFDALFLIDQADPQRAAKAVLLNADALGSTLATVYGALHATDPAVATHWLAELLRIFEALVQGTYAPAFVIDMAALRAVQQQVLDWGRSMGGLQVPDALPDDVT